jgi:hypothetical protein
MTPKEKASNLVDKMHIESDIIYVMSKAQAKKCALIAVDEILNQFTWKPSTGMSYWQEVKQEIEKL